jgi:hypothetical protein
VAVSGIAGRNRRLPERAANLRSRVSADRPRERTAARTPPPSDTHGADQANV